MVTSTSTVMGGEETAEQKAARIKAARQAGMEKARQARAAKASQETGSQDEVLALPSAKGYLDYVEDNAWHQVFMIAMKNFEIKSPLELGRCSTLADAAVAEMKKQGRL